MQIWLKIAQICLEFYQPEDVENNAVFDSQRGAA